MCRAIVGNVPGRGGGWLGDCGLGGGERVMCSIDGQISFMGTALWNQGHMAAQCPPSKPRVQCRWKCDLHFSYMQGPQLMATGQQCQYWNRIGIEHWKKTRHQHWTRCLWLVQNWKKTRHQDGAGKCNLNLLPFRAGTATASSHSWLPWSPFTHLD